MFHSAAPKKRAVLDVSDRQHAFAEHSHKEETSAKTALPESALKVLKALLRFHETAHVYDCLGDEWLSTKMQRKTNCRIEVAVKVATMA